MSDFAQYLQEKLPTVIDRPVVDRTGLKGVYDFQFASSPLAGRGDPQAEGVTIFEALDRQLGLRLEPQRHSVPVLVIDRAERIPATN